MTKHYALSAAQREKVGKGSARALRREEKIPAVIYGDKKAPVSIALPIKEVTMEYHKGHMFTSLCDMDVAGNKVQVLARDVQLHPVTDVVEHVDFLRVNDKTMITVSVPVHMVNYEESNAAREKAVINMVRHEVDLVCQATKIPEAIEIEMKDADIGLTVKLSDLSLPQGAKSGYDRDPTILTLMAPKRLGAAEDEAEGAEGDAAAEGESAEGADAAPEEKSE